MAATRVGCDNLSNWILEEVFQLDLPSRLEDTDRHTNTRKNTIMACLLILWKDTAMMQLVRDLQAL